MHRAHSPRCWRCTTRIKLDKKGVSPQAVISEGATHGTDCYIGALAFIGENARIGNNVKIYPQATSATT